MSQSKIKHNEADHERSVADRLKLAADSIRAQHLIPPTEICDAVGDSAWFREYMNICLGSPISNAFLGCVLFGWQLAEEYRKIESATGVIYRA